MDPLKLQRATLASVTDPNGVPITCYKRGAFYFYRDSHGRWIMALTPYGYSVDGVSHKRLRDAVGASVVAGGRATVQNGIRALNSGHSVPARAVRMLARIAVPFHGAVPAGYLFDPVPAAPAPADPIPV